MVVWAEVCPYEDHFEKERFVFLSEYLKKNGIENEVHFEVCSTVDLESKLLECQDKYDQLRIHPDYGHIVVQQSERTPAEIISVGAADGFQKQDGGWWLRSSLFKAFHHIVSDKGENIDAESSALIVGTGSRARVMISGVIKLGFNKVNISSIFDEQGMELVEELKKKYFGVDFNFVPQSRLVTLPGIHGIMVNTTPFNQNNELIAELNYYNFLQQEGFVIDCNMFPVRSELTKEAENIGAYVIQGYELLATADVLWANEIFGVQLNEGQYVSEFLQKFETQEVTEETSLS